MVMWPDERAEPLAHEPPSDPETRQVTPAYISELL